MKFDDPDAEPAADPTNPAHPLWAALQLAKLLRETYGFDRQTIATALCEAAVRVACENGDVLAFAVHMQVQANRINFRAGQEVAIASGMVRN